MSLYGLVRLGVVWCVGSVAVQVLPAFLGAPRGVRVVWNSILFFHGSTSPAPKEQLILQTVLRTPPFWLNLLAVSATRGFLLQSISGILLWGDFGRLLGLRSRGTQGCLGAATN